MNNTQKSAGLEDLKKEKKIIYHNNIRSNIQSYKQLEKVNFDLDSPRMKRAMESLGFTLEDCQRK